MGFFREAGKLSLMVAVAIILPLFIVHPIVKRFFPDLIPTSSTSVPLPNLQEIISHQLKLQDLQRELESYLSPDGREAISKLIQDILIINDSLSKGSDPHATLDQFVEDIDDNLYSKLYSLENRVISLTNPAVMEGLDTVFEASRELGIVLDNSEELEEDDEKMLMTSEQNCFKALNSLAQSLLEANKLTDMITKLYKEVEARRQSDMSTEDLNVSEQVDYYDKESTRLTEQMDTIVQESHKDLSRTKDFISSTTATIQSYFDKLKSEFDLSLITNQEFHATFILERIRPQDGDDEEIETSRKEEL